jgi:hypothetical protein
MTASTVRHKFLAAEFDYRLGGNEPLLNVADWYAEQYCSDTNVELQLDHGDWDCSANEIAALRLGCAGFQSEDEIATRACDCTDRCENEAHATPRCRPRAPRWLAIRS